jgi:superfamily II DNA/RNA helicase
MNNYQNALPAEELATPTTNSNAVVPVLDFTSLNLPEELSLALTRMSFTTPTEIQSKAIPFGLQGRDVLGSAQTGTGKTLAFVIPMLAKLMTSSRGSALILLPTRELAVQVEKAISTLLGFRSKMRTAVLIGGEPMPKQYMQLRANPRIIVGTPGRINDHLQRGTVKLHDASYLVLDETDRMLDMGFGIQIDEILKYLPKQRQTMLFSATLPAEIVRISKNYMVDPVRVSAGSTTTPSANIKQVVIKLSEEEKYATLIEHLDAPREGSVIIFAKTKRNVEKLSDKLQRKSYKVDYIHGDLKQSRRDRVISSYHNEKFRILVATDVAARGLDVPHIKLVINYDLPQVPEDYIHRIGRTARAGAEGEALCLIAPADNGKWRDIQRLINPSEAGSGVNGGGSSAPRRGGNNDRNRSGGARREGGRDSNPYAPKAKTGFFGGGARKGGVKTFGFKDRDAQGEGRSSERRFEDKPARRFEARPERSENRFEGKPARSFESRPERSENRFEGKPARSFEGKPAGRFGGKSEGRFEGKPAGRYEGKSEGKPAGKPAGKTFGFGNKSEGKPSGGFKPSRTSSFRDAGKSFAGAFKKKKPSA